MICGENESLQLPGEFVMIEMSVTVTESTQDTSAIETAEISNCGGISVHQECADGLSEVTMQSVVHTSAQTSPSAGLLICRTGSPIVNEQDEQDELSLSLSEYSVHGIVGV